MSRPRQGLWPKNGFMGVEVTGKTLGLIGAGNIGSIVASRAGPAHEGGGLRSVPHARARVEMGVEKADLDTLLAKADFITLHTPLTTRREHPQPREPGQDQEGRAHRQLRAWRADRRSRAEGRARSGHVAGAALDVFQTEPAKESPLFGTKNFICTPHLGASTTEAQVNVALQVAEQLGEYLTTGGVTNALNVPSLSAEEAPLRPYMALAEKLGSLVGQLTPSAVARISIHTEGAAAELNAKPIVAAVLAGFLRVQSATVNMVNAPFLAKERGLEVREVKTEKAGDYHTSSAFR
jgi:D-3-phosphoglycerate dehydrogenase